MNRTPIPWVQNPDGSQGYTWNPITGCSPISDGCRNCYGQAILRRFKKPLTVTFHPDRIDEPIKIKKASRIFVCSMGDLFYAGRASTARQINRILGRKAK